MEQTPAEVFAAIKSVRRWWLEIEGHANNVCDTFEHHFEDMHRCELKVKDLVPGKKVVWTVLGNYFSFTKDKTEWTGTVAVWTTRRMCRTRFLSFRP